MVASTDLERLLLNRWKFIGVTFADTMLDIGDDIVGPVLIPAEHEPARALRNEEPEDKDDEAKASANTKGEPPADSLREMAWQMIAEEKHGSNRAAGGAEPKRPVDDKVYRSPELSRNELVDRGVDCGILAADANACKKA